MFASRWQLSIKFYRASINFIKENKELLILPILSLIFIALTTLIEFSYLFKASHYKAIFTSSDDFNTATCISLIAFVVLLTMAVNFFSCAFYYCVLKRLQNIPCSISEGMKQSTRYIGKMFSWSLIKVALDFVFHIIASFGRVGRFVEILLQVSWSILSMFVIPAMIMRNIGPVTALKESGTMIKKNWRKNFSMAIVTFLVTAIFILVGFLLQKLLEGSAFIAPASATPAIIIGSLLVLWTLTLRIFVIPLIQITNSALYLYNTKHDISHFDNGLLAEAFSERKSSRLINRMF